MLNRYTMDKLKRIEDYVEEARKNPKFFTKYAKKEIRRILGISRENLRLGYEDAKIVIQSANKALEELRELSRKHKANALETLDESLFKRRRIREKSKKKKRKGLETFTEEDLFRKKVEPVRRERILESEEEFNDEEEKEYNDAISKLMEAKDEEETEPLWLEKIYERQIKGFILINISKIAHSKANKR